MAKYLMLMAILAVTLSCEKNDKNTPPMGSELGPCYPNGTCDEGFVCLSDICVDPNETPDEIADDILSEEDTIIADDDTDDDPGTDDLPDETDDKTQPEDDATDIDIDPIESDTVELSDEDALLASCATENEVRFFACGYNGNGLQKQKCISHQWVDSGDCVDPDVCENDTDGDVPCGLNGRGLEPAFCEDGQWTTTGGVCIDPDDCVDGTQQPPYGTSECVAGQWVLRRVTEQWGTDSDDYGNSVAVDGTGNIFVTGYTNAPLDDNTAAGARDIFLTKWGADGIKAWTKQWGSAGWDTGSGVAVDGAGNIFVAGDTEGALDDNTNAGTYDIFLTKWNANGTKAWTKQWGSESVEFGKAVAVDGAGNIFVTGWTSGALDGNTLVGEIDIFLTKWNADGTKAWTKQWGTSASDHGYAVAVDGAGNIFVTGSTSGALDGNTLIGGTDIFLTKWNADGTKAWTKQRGTPGDDHGRSVAVDGAGNIFVTGETRNALDGNLYAGSSSDVFLIKWTADGTREWTKQWGTATGETEPSVAVDGAGDIFVTGSTVGALDGNTNAGEYDLFLTKWNHDGTKVWTKQWGSSASDQAYAVALSGTGRIYVAGQTPGALDGNSNAGWSDVFLSTWLP
ncbi:MAG TPA: SBBP repeat-containing protein [bacterium]|nr:SBBP repeat-containing protein [bacterium]